MEKSSLQSFVNSTHSLSYAYSCLNTILENFLVMSKSIFPKLKDYTKGASKSLRSNINSITGTYRNLGDKKKILIEKDRFITLIKSTLDLSFTKEQKKFLLGIVSKFYEIQEVEKSYTTRPNGDY